MRQVLGMYFTHSLKTHRFLKSAIALLPLLILLNSCDQKDAVNPINSDPVAEKLKTSVNTTSQRLNKQIDSLNDSFNEALLASQIFINEHKNWSSDSIQTALQGIHSSETLFNEAGFQLTLVSIDLSLSPKCILTFIQTKKIVASDKEAILHKLADQKLNHLLLQTLFKAHEMDLNPYSIHDINIHLSLIPKVRINLKGKMQ